MTKPKTKRRAKHYFRFQMENNGHTATFMAGAKVRTPSRAVTLTVTEADVLKSMKLKGVGNTQNCTMSVCCQRHENEFNHPVGANIIDWQYRTAYVVSKFNKDGLPSECYRYLHNSKIAHLNDTVGGQKKLLEMIREQGDITVVLSPRRRNDVNKKGGSGKRDGSRSTSLSGATGAKLRYATAYPGLTPPPVAKTA